MLTKVDEPGGRRKSCCSSLRTSSSMEHPLGGGKARPCLAGTEPLGITQPISTARQSKETKAYTVLTVNRHLGKSYLSFKMAGKEWLLVTPNVGCFKYYINITSVKPEKHINHQYYVEEAWAKDYNEISKEHKQQWGFIRLCEKVLVASLSLFGYGLERPTLCLIRIYIFLTRNARI